MCIKACYVCSIKHFRFSDHYHTCQQWVEKLLEEKGTFSMKAQHKQLLDNDSSRAKLLLLIEESLLHHNKMSEVLRNTAALVLLLFTE